MNTALADKIYAAKWDLDATRGHLDTAACLIDSAIEHLDEACKTRATEILDRITATLADLDRLREVLAEK